MNFKMGYARNERLHVFYFEELFDFQNFRKDHNYFCIYRYLNLS